MRRNHIKKGIVIMSLLMAMTVFMASCGENDEIQPQDTTSAVTDTDAQTTEHTPEFTVDENGKVLFCGYPVDLAGNAVVDRNVLSAPDSGTNTATLDLGDAGCYELTYTVTMHSFSSGIVDLFYDKDEDIRYALVLDAENSRAAIHPVRKGISGAKRYQECAIALDQPIRVKIASYPDYFRVYIANADGQFDYPAFDMLFERQSNVFRFQCNTENVTFSELSVNYDVTEPDSSDSYINPITRGADPYILYEDGVYYLYTTNAVMEGFRVQTSTDLVHWENRGFCLKTADIYGEPTSSAGFWAPEVYHIGDRYVMTYSVNERIGIAVSDSPLGPFVSPAPRYLVEHRAIDSSIFVDDDGTAYLYYVSFDGVPYGIYGRTINTDTWEVGEEHFLFTANSGEWDGQDGKVSEGPYMLKHNGIYYLTYSGNGYTSHKYAVGYAVASSPLGNFKKYKNNPILSQIPENEAYGTGHHAFFTAENGELYIVYHRHLSQTQVNERQVCIDRVFFVTVPGEKYDRLVIAGPTSSPQSF